MLEAKEHIEFIINSSKEDRDLSMLVQYPIDIIIPFFQKTKDLFHPPVGWYLKSETDKISLIMEWIMKRLNRNAEVEFLWPMSVEASLKVWVLNAMELLETSKEEYEEQFES